MTRPSLWWLALTPLSGCATVLLPYCYWRLGVLLFGGDSFMVKTIAMFAVAANCLAAVIFLTRRALAAEARK